MHSRGPAHPAIGRSLYAYAVLIDTSAFLALANPNDPNHASARACLAGIVQRRLPAFVPIPIIYESHRRFLYDLGVPRALIFLENVFDGSMNIVRTVEDDEYYARAILIQYQGFRLSLADAANVAIMIRLGIAAIFSFDSHYLSIGVIRIPPLHL